MADKSTFQVFNGHTCSKWVLKICSFLGAIHLAGYFKPSMPTETICTQQKRTATKLPSEHFHTHTQNMVVLT